MTVETGQKTVVDEKAESGLFCSYLKTLRDNGVRKPKKKGPQGLGFPPGFSYVLDEIDAEGLTWSAVLDPSDGHESLRQKLLELKPENLWGMPTRVGLKKLMANIDARYGK